MRYKYLIIPAMVALTVFLYSPTPAFAVLLGSADEHASQSIRDIGGLAFDEHSVVVPVSTNSVVTPEPATLALLGLGLIGLRFRKNKIV